jgi:hypothetical protein
MAAMRSSETETTLAPFTESSLNSVLVVSGGFWPHNCFEKVMDKSNSYTN